MARDVLWRKTQWRREMFRPQAILPAAVNRTWGENQETIRDRDTLEAWNSPGNPGEVVNLSSNSLLHATDVARSR